jgi:hypothetical protein
MACTYGTIVSSRAPPAPQRRLQAADICAIDRHRRAEHAPVTLPARVFVGLAKRFGHRRRAARREKRGHIELLPDREIFPHDQRHVRIEHAASL